MSVHALHHALTDFQDIARRAREAEHILEFGEALIAIQEIAENQVRQLRHARQAA